MKHLTINWLAAMLLLVSCGQPEFEPEIVGPEPEPVFVLESDSITSGEMLGIGIGSTAAEAYEAIQEVQRGKNSPHLQIVSNVFTRVTDLKDRLHLYSQLLFDETRGTSRGVQVYFENDKIKSIWTNNGDKLTGWPSDKQVPARLSVGDPVSEVYPKLIKLSTDMRYAIRFGRISLFDKNTEKPFDPIMADSPQWYFSLPAGEKRFHVYYLHFDEGRLAAIKRDLMGNNSYQAPE